MSAEGTGSTYSPDALLHQCTSAITKYFKTHGGHPIVLDGPIGLVDALIDEVKFAKRTVAAHEANDERNTRQIEAFRAQLTYIFDELARLFLYANRSNWVDDGKFSHWALVNTIRELLQKRDAADADQRQKLHVLEKDAKGWAAKAEKLEDDSEDLLRKIETLKGIISTGDARLFAFLQEHGVTSDDEPADVVAAVLATARAAHTRVAELETAAKNVDTERNVLRAEVLRLSAQIASDKYLDGVQAIQVFGRTFVPQPDKQWKCMACGVLFRVPCEHICQPVA